MADAEEAKAEEKDGKEAAAKATAEAEKKLGTDAYKRRDFAVAITHFNRAWETWPEDITFLTNLGGGYIFLCYSYMRGLMRTCPVYLRSCVF
jgi:Flp pilus assembly protein TadD